MKKSRRILMFFTLLFVVCFMALSVSAAGQPAATKVTAANVASTGKIKLTWTAVDGAAKYQVYRSAEKNSGYSLLYTTTGTQLVNSSVKTGETWYYYVVTVDADGNKSAKSNTASRTCDLPAPAVTASNVASTGKIKLSWKAVDGAAKYQVYRSLTGESGSYTLLTTTKNTSVTNTKTTAGTQYYYKVRAVHTNSSANGAYTSVSRTCDLPRPVITISTNSANRPVLSWKAVSGAVKYQVYRATAENGSYTLLTSTTGTSVTDTAVKAKNSYYYKVRAVHTNTSANSAYSAVKSLTTGTSANDIFVDAYIYSTYAVLYEKPDTASSSVLLKYREKVGVGADFATYDHGRWSTVMYNGKVYYNWIEKGVTRYTDEEAFEYINSGNSTLQNQVLELALRYPELPTSYLHGESEGVLNENGTYGFDCSGFAAYVLNNTMTQYNPLYSVTKSITGLHETQTVYNSGFNNQFDVQDIDLADIQPGDLVFFDVYEDSRDVDHVGIYLGNNEFIHATSFHDCVMISPLRDEFVDNFRGVKRYFPDEIKPAEQKVVTNYDWVYIYPEAVSNPSKDTALYAFELGEEATMLYTGTSNWCYVRSKTGVEGYSFVYRFDTVE